MYSTILDRLLNHSQWRQRTTISSNSKKFKENIRIWRNDFSTKYRSSNPHKKSILKNSSRNLKWFSTNWIIPMILVSRESKKSSMNLIIHCLPCGKEWKNQLEWFQGGISEAFTWFISPGDVNRRQEIFFHGLFDEKQSRRKMFDIDFTPSRINTILWRRKRSSMVHTNRLQIFRIETIHGSWNRNSPVLSHWSCHYLV